jgi:hypothetical protein
MTSKLPGQRLERPEEEYARTALTAHLGGRGIWDLGADPPDYELRLDGRSWAIEVTAVVDAAALQQPEQLRRVAEQVARTARDEGNLRRGYSLISTRGAHVLTRQEHSQLAKQLLGVVRQDHDEEKVVVGDGQYVVRAVSDRLGFAWWASFGEMRASQGAADLLRAALETIIRSKERKLRNVAAPKVLLVLNGEHFVAGRDLEPALFGLEPGPFAAVYLIRGPAEVTLVVGEADLKRL